MRSVLVYLLIMIASPVVADGLPEQAIVRVTRVLDGDTFVGQFQSTSMSIDLLGVVAPRKDLDQPHHEESKMMLRQLIGGKEVQVHFRRIEDRLLAIASLGNNSINLAMIESGGGWYQPGQVDSVRLKQAEQLARSRQLGLWSAAIGPIPPWQYQQHLDSLSKARQTELTRDMVEMMAKSFSRSGGLPMLEHGRVELQIPGSLGPISLGHFLETKLVVTWKLPDRIAFDAKSAYTSRKPTDVRPTTVLRRNLVIDGADAWYSSEGTVRDATEDDIRFARVILAGIQQVAQLPNALNSTQYTVDLAANPRPQRGLVFTSVPQVPDHGTRFRLLCVIPSPSLRCIEIDTTFHAEAFYSPFSLSLLKGSSSFFALTPEPSSVFRGPPVLLILSAESPAKIGYGKRSSWWRYGDYQYVFVNVSSVELLADDDAGEHEMVFKRP